MHASAHRTRAQRMLMRLLFAIGTLLLVSGSARAQCIGDCNGNGMVTIDELIVGVNIDLGNLPVSACPSFACDDGQVMVNCLVSGVNNAQNGCPETPTTTPTRTNSATPSSSVTATTTATNTASATSTVTATFTATSTPTETGVPTGTATATATETETPTGIPTGTATATATPTETGIPTGTATATATETETETPTGIPTGTATATSTPADTDTPASTPTPSDTPAPTLTATEGPSPTPTDTAAPTATPSETPSPSPTETAVSAGQAVGGRAAIVATGLGGIQSLVGAVVAAAANQGGTPPVSLAGERIADPPTPNACEIDGQTTRECTEMAGSPGQRSIHLALTATNCIVDGPTGGTAKFDGAITLDSAVGLTVLVGCNPIRFLSATYDVQDLTAVFRNGANLSLTVSADLQGTVAPTALSGQCIVGGLNLTLTGSLTAQLPSGTGVTVTFDGTQVAMSNIVYNSNCIPVSYTLTFNGSATFQPLQDALLEVTSTLVTDGAADVTNAFTVVFDDFALAEDGSTNPASVTMNGALSSDCFGGAVGVSTFTALSVPAGQICPSSGRIDVTAGEQTEMISYSNGMVSVTAPGADPVIYPSCYAPELLTCS